MSPVRRPFAKTRLSAWNTSDFQLRLWVSFGLIVLMFGALTARFVYLQVLQYEALTIRAAGNRLTLIPTPPIRGEITDINGVVLARNYPAYSLEIVPANLTASVDDTIAALQPLVEISAADIKRFRKFQTDFRMYDKIPLKMKLSVDEASRLSAQLYRFPGVEVNARTFREYPYGPLTAHLLGYIGRISENDQKKIDEANQTALYRGTVYIGKGGLENYYETQLHGTPGFQEVEKDAQGNTVKVIRSQPPRNGQTLKLALDIRMQQMADKLLGNRKGAMVAINPQNGDILAMVSKPTYDPNLFIDGIDADTWNALNNNPDKPLINRAIQGLYPPGSTFKPFMAMAALQSGTVTPGQMVPSPGAWSIPGSTHLFRDSVRRGHGMVNISTAIQVSSDTFFYQIGYRMGVDKAATYLREFGFGEKTGIDLPHEAGGVLPTREWKENRFKKYRPEVRAWMPADMVSASIGQGYNAYSPLQMAYATAQLANDGTVYQPHLGKVLLDHSSNNMIVIDPNPVHQLNFQPGYFALVKEAMTRVLKPGGTARAIGSGLKYSMGGKTGTAQVVQIKQGASYNAGMLPVKYRDHAWFIAFAPVDKPQIAIAVIVENGGWGASSAPLARQLADYYLLTLGHLNRPENPTAVQAASAAASDMAVPPDAQASQPSGNVTPPRLPVLQAFMEAGAAPTSASGVSY